MSSNEDFLADKEKERLLNQAARMLGQKGGPAAAQARFSKMTTEERSEHGRRLVAARWAKRDAEAGHEQAEG